MKASLLLIGTLLDAYVVKKNDVEDRGIHPGGPWERQEGGGVMEKERLRDRVCGAVKPICTCFSFAARQAREAEIDVPSKRRFRQGALSGEASSAIPQDAGAVLHEVTARRGTGVRAFLDCLDDARKRAEERRTDAFSRMSYRKLPD